MKLRDRDAAARLECCRRFGRLVAVEGRAVEVDHELRDRPERTGGVDQDGRMILPQRQHLRQRRADRRRQFFVAAGNRFACQGKHDRDASRAMARRISANWRIEPMHYLLIYELAPDYLERRGPLRSAHLAAANAAVQRGELVLGGALANPADQAILLFSGDSPAAAEAFARADPYVLNGLVRHWRVREWTTVIGQDAAFRVT
jgi:uncharacterized protein YciI